MRISDWSSDVCSSDLTRQLLSEAQRIAYDVQSIQQAFEGRYKGSALTGDHAQMVANANARWEDSVGALEDALRVQAGVVGNIDGTRTSIDTLVGASQSASGSLQAAQAGKMGRAACRGGVWQYVKITVVAGSLKKK